MIVVTGANGTLGRLVVEQVLAELPAARVAVSVRDPAGARDLADRGVRVRRGDFTDPASLDAAFEGAEQVLVLSGSTLGGAGVAQHRAAIDAAVRAGASRVLYTAHHGARHDSTFAPALDHAATEDLLASSGVPWTSLRNGFYASSLEMLLGRGPGAGELRLPADGPVAWTTREDLAAAAARLLVDGAPDGPVPLTGPAAIDLEEVAGIVSGVVGHRVRRVVVEPGEYRDALVASGVPAPAADLLLGFFPAARRGDFAPAEPTLAAIVGRPATSMATHLAAVLTPDRA